MSQNRRAGWILGDVKTDGDLLHALTHGDPSALTALIERHGRLVVSGARAILRDHHAAEDVTQAVFLVLARKAHRLRRRATIGPGSTG